MRYVSTRGKSPDLSFEETMLTGLAPDGGLYVPENVPVLPPEMIRVSSGSVSRLSMASTACSVARNRHPGGTW